MLLARTPQTNDASPFGNRVLKYVPFCVVPESVMFGVRIDRIMVLYLALSDLDVPF